jgi:polyvinyl alcohol dehydrogenase (cytochrome)
MNFMESSMKPIVLGLLAVALIAGLVVAWPALGRPDAAGVSAIAVAPEDTMAHRIFQARCVSCHGDVAEYAPSRHALATRTPEIIESALTVGSMRAMADGLSRTEIEALANYLGTEPVVQFAAQNAACTHPPQPLNVRAGDWNGWGRDVHNSRYQPNPGIRAQDIPRLAVKWAFGYTGGGTVTQPTVVGDRIFIASRDVYALDANTGCTYWTYPIEGRGARAAITVAPMPGSPQRHVAYVADLSNYVHAIDATTGEGIWRTNIGDHPAAQLTGAPVLHEGRLYVPISSGEESRAGAPGYECCTFRGGVAAVDAATGELIWRSFAIPEEPVPFQRNVEGVQMYGPAGAAIWSAVTVDAGRNAIYAGTGNSYTEVEEKGSSAIVAFDLRTGALKWTNQVTENDNYVVGCFGPSEGRGPPHANCPEELGPDWDFGASPILRNIRGGRQILVSGQKSGIVYGMDPATGAKIWQTRLGVGGPLGGVQWGMAADDDFIYVAISDEGHYNFRTEDPRPGLSALRIETGEVVWTTPAPPRDCAWGEVERPGVPYVPGGCSNAMAAPVTLIPGAVFAPSVDGNIRAYSTRDGSVFWTFNTARSYATVNGVPAKGGSLNATGAVLVNGTMFLNSGYSAFGGEPGNVLLAFTVDGR